MNSLPFFRVPNEDQFVSLSGALSDESKLELLEYWRSVIKGKWLILAAGFLAAGLAGAVVFSLPPVYRAMTTVLIEQTQPKVASIADVYGGVTQDKEHYQTQIEILKSREVGSRVAKALKLWEYPEFDGRKLRPGWTARVMTFVGMGEAPPKWTEDKLLEVALARYASRLSVEPVRASQLVKVSFESQDRELSAQVANAVAEEFTNADREARFKMTQQANTWLQDRTQLLRDKLAASERALQVYRDRQGIVTLSGSAQTMIGQQIGEITQRLMEAKTRRADAESAFNQMKLIQDGDYSSVPAVIRNGAVAEAKKQESAASMKVAELQQRYGTEHIKMVQALSEQKSAKENLMRQMQAVADSLTREYETARNTERALGSALGAARGTVQTQNHQEFQLGVLDREVQANKQLYETFMNRVKETNVSADLQSSVARVVDSAVAPSLPVKPQKMQVVAIALILGLVAGVLTSLLSDKLDNTVKGPEDAERRFQLAVLTAVPLLNRTDAKQAPTIFLTRPDSHLAEAIRTARTGVLLSDIDLTKRILLVTSSVPGEGKTTLCTNLALAHAQTKRTLLIDADMRQPQIASRLGLAPGVKGLSNLVSGSAVLADCVHDINNSTLDVMPVGDLPPNPLEMLLSQRFRDLLKTLTERYEIIIIDSPPVELVSDALVLAPLVTSTIFVASAMRTPSPLIRKALVRLQRTGGKVLGIVLNNVNFSKSRNFYGEYSGYGKNGYEGYGYAPLTRT